jgi:hypothetical protein
LIKEDTNANTTRALRDPPRTASSRENLRQ